MTVDPFEPYHHPEDFSLDGEGAKWGHRPMIVPSGPSVIVVGPDGVGKTHIVDKISQMMHIPRFKFPSEAKVFRQGQNGQLLFDLGLAHFLKQTRHRFISDRGYPCEWVYSIVFERQTDLDLLLAIDEVHASIHTKILYLWASEQPTEEDELVDAKYYWKVKESYDRFCEWTKCRVYRFDTSESLGMDNHERAKYDATKCLTALGMIG